MTLTLNSTTISTPSDEILRLNLRSTTGSGITYLEPGQTISYSILTNTTNHEDIFDAYKDVTNDTFSFEGSIASNWAANIATAMQAVNEIINITFTYESTASFSDLRWVAVSDANHSNLLGYTYLPGSFDDMDGLDGYNDTAIFIYKTEPYQTGIENDAELGGGNLRTETMLHELGHVLGLVHPHTYTTSDAPFDELNDSKYDLMSYLYSDSDRKVAANNGTITSAFNFGSFVNYTPINIAALQYLYGANTTTHTINNTYTLTDGDTVALDIDGSDGDISIGRAYYTIWDNDGTADEIVYSGNNRVLLNLNAATLNRTTNDADLVETLDRVASSDYYDELYGDYRSEITDSKYYAGGFFSQILTDDDSVSIGVDFDSKYANTLGGYVIANGVIIENATGGDGDDLIIGNAVANILTGGAGNDTIFDGNGNDIVYGGIGNDTFYVGKGDDIYNDSNGTDIANLYTAFTRYYISVSGNQVTITDIIDNKYGTNIFNNVDLFTFAGSTFTVSDLPTDNEYEREYADELHNDFLLDFALSGGTGYDFV